MKTKMKKLMITTIALLTVGSGVIIANQMKAESNNNPHTEATNVQEKSQTLNTLPVLPKTFNLGGNTSTTLTNNGEKVETITSVEGAKPQTYNTATTNIAQMNTTIANTKEASKTKETIRMPDEQAIIRLNGTSITNNRKLINASLYDSMPAGTQYWLGTEDTSSQAQKTITSDGIYAPLKTITNGAEHKKCTTSKTYNGALKQTTTIPGSSTQTTIQLYYPTGAYPCTRDLADLYRASSCNFTNGYSTCQTEGGAIPDSATNFSPFTLEQLGSPEAYSVSTAQCYFTNYDQKSDQLYCYKPRKSTVCKNMGLPNTPARVATTTRTVGIKCTAKAHPAETALTRTLIEADLSSVVFASASKDTSNDINDTNFMNDSGPYLTAQDDVLNAVQLTDQSAYPIGYVLAGDQIIIPREIIKDGKIRIPVNFNGSQYESKADFKSDHAIIVTARNTKTDQTYYGRLAPSDDSAANGDGIMYADFSVTDLVGVEAGTGQLNSVELEVSLYNNELISNNGNDKYLDFVSSPMNVTVFIGTPQKLEWDDVDNIDKALLPGESVDVTARLSSKSTGWDTASEFELVNKTDLEQWFTVKEGTAEPYTSKPGAPAVPFEGDKGKITYSFTLKNDASFNDGDEVEIKVKKLTNDPTKYAESEELTYKIKLYHHMTDATVEPYNVDDADLSASYSEVVKDTKLLKVTPTLGMPGEFKYSLVGDEAVTKLFKIEPGTADDCGTNADKSVKDCAIVSATQMIDYSAEKYPFTIKVENNIATKEPVSYSDTVNKESGYTITQREIEVQPTLTSTTMSYGDELPTIGYTTINGTSVLDSDKESMGKLNTHFENTEHQKVDIATAPSGVYTLVFDEFSADKDKKRFENYTITNKTTIDLTVNKGESSELYIDPNINVIYGDNSYTYKDQAGKQQSSDLTLHAQGGTCGVDKSTSCEYAYEVTDGKDVVEITNTKTGAFKIKKAGTAKITITKAEDEYFTGKTKEVTITVAPRPLKLTTGDQTLTPEDDALPGNEIKFLDNTSLAYNEKVADFTWEYVYKKDGITITPPAEILKSQDPKNVYTITPVMKQTVDGPLVSNYAITYGEAGKLYITDQQITDAQKADYYKVDELPSYAWYNKADKLGIYPINQDFSEMRVYLKNSDDTLTIVRDYSSEDYHVDKNLCNGATCTFALKFRNPINHAVTTTLEEVLPIDNVLPKIEKLEWTSKPQSLAFLYSMFDSEYNTPAELSVSASDATSGILDYSYVITEVDKNGKPNGLTTKQTNVNDNTITVSDKGYYKVDVTVRDKAHNTSTVKTTYVAIDDSLPEAPSVEAFVNEKPWDVSKWSKENITLKLTASDKSEDGDFHGEVDHYEVLVPGSDTTYVEVKGDTYTTSEAEINGTYTFKAVYKNGTASKPITIDLLVDKKAHAFSATAKENVVDGVVTSMTFDLKLSDTYASKETWYVYLAETGKSDGAWEEITLSEANQWTLRENFKGKVYFKNISEAGISTEDNLENLTPVPDKETEVQDDAYLKIEAISEDQVYRGEWTNKGITLKASGGAASSSDIKTYAFSMDGGASWTEILNMSDVTGQLVHQGNDTITFMGAQELNTDIQFKAIYVDSSHAQSEIKAVHVQYDGVKPKVELTKTPEDEMKSYASVKIILNVKDGEASSPVKRYSFDGGKTWSEAGADMSKTFEEAIANGRVIVEDVAGNRTTLNFTIQNIRPDKPKPPVVVNGDLYVTGMDNWYNMKQLLEVEHSDDGDIYYRLNGGQDTKYDETAKIEVLKEGRNVVEVWIAGSNGLSSDVISLDVNLDFTKPKDLKLNYTQGTFFDQLTNLVTGKKIYVEISGEDDLSGVGQIQYQVVKKDGTYNEANWRNGSKFPMEEDFDGYIYARVIDKAGNQMETVEADRATVTIDGTGPAITTIQDMTAWGNAKAAQVKVEDALSGSDGDLYYQIADSEDDTKYTKVALVNGSFDVPLSNGDHNLYLMAKDKVGNITKKTVHLMIDQVPVVITPTYTGTSATFSITTGVSGLKELYVTSGSGVREKVDFDGSDGVYTASYTFTANGLYQFTAVNNAGVSASTGNKMISSVDDVKPVLGVISDYKEGTWSGKDVTLKAVLVNNFDVTTIEYKTDNDVWKPYEAGTVLTETREGVSTYSFIANRGTDTESDVVSFVVKIDKSAPAMPIIVNKDSYGASIWHNASTKVQAKKQVTNGCTEELYYSLDGGTQWTKADNYTFPAEGQYVILFRAVDELGRSSDEAQAIVNIDTTAPSNFAINVNQDQFKELINFISFGLFYNENVNVDFEADYAISGEGTTYYYISDKALSSLEVMELANNPAKWSKGDHFSITTDFKGVIYARTTDLAGNSTGIISSDGLEVKFTGAILNASNRNGKDWGSDDEVSISSSDFETIESLSYVINTPSPTGGTLTLDEKGKALLPLTDNGEYSVTFTALDKFGNTSTAKINTRIDNVKPEVSIVQDLQNSTEDVAVLKISGSAGISGIQSVYLVNEDTGERQYVRFDSTNSFTYKKACNGTYKAELTNGAGVMAEASVTVSSLSETKPEVSVSAVSNNAAYIDNTWTTSPVDLTISEASSLAGATFEYRDITTDAKAAWSALPTNPMNVSANGVHHYQFRAKSADGTQVSEPKDFTVKISTGDGGIDDYIPDVKDEDKDKVTDDPDGTTPVNKDDVTIDPEIPVVPGDDTPELKRWVEYNIDDDLEWKTALPIVVTGEGKHKVTMHTKDELGRISNKKTYYVIIDTTAPTNLAIQLEDNTFKVFINNVTFGTFYQENKEAAISATDAVTGVAEYQYQIVRDGEAFNIDGSWESITAPAVTTYAASNATVTLEKGFKGVVYARAIDHAGNISNVISTDGIVIDYISPNIQMKHDMSDWKEDTGIHVTLSDDLSGVKEADYAVYKITNGTAEADPIETGVMQVVDHKGVISGFDNGEYKVEVKALDRSGNEQKNNAIIKVDNEAPTIRSEVSADENDLSYKNITSIVTAPVSGIKDVRMSSDKLGTSILNADSNGSYQVKVYAAGTYTFTITANNGKTATSSITIGEGEIINDQPVVGLKGEYIADSSEYISDTWGFDGIRLIASNLVTDLENVTFQYYIDEAGNKAPDASTAWIDSDDGILRVYKNGTYYVRGFIKGEADDGSDDIVGEPAAFIVKLDLTGPKRVIVTNPNNFTVDTWHDTDQSVAATFTKETPGANEWVEVSIDGGAWVKTASSNSSADPLPYSVTVKEDGAHTVKYRSVDEAGRMSLETTAYVNIDRAKTTDDTLKLSASLRNKESDAYRDIVLTPVVGASGVKEIVFDGLNGSNQEVITQNEAGQYIYRAKVNGTYAFTLTSGNGKTANTSIKVDGITNLDPIVNAIVKGTALPYKEYKDLDKWIGEAVTLSAKDVNSTNAGVTPYTTEFFLKTGDKFSDKSSGDTVNIAASGTYTYKVVMSYTDASNVLHTGETEVSVKVDLENVNDIKEVVNADQIGADKWIGASSSLTDIKAIFEPHTTGCEEWAEISMDNVNWVKGTGDNVTRTLEDLPDGRYTFYFRTNDELNTGSGKVTQAEVQIDRTSGKLFHVEYEKVPAGPINFLKSLITDEDYQFRFDGNFDISTLDHIDYRILNDGEQFNTNNPKFNGTLTNLSDTVAVSGKTFNGKICGQGTDKAGNKTIIACSDPLLVDKDTPDITVNSGSIPADDATKTWFGVRNNATVTLKELPFSDFKEKSYTLKPDKGTPADPNDTREDIKGELSFVNANGTITSQITDIPDGKWTLDVTVTSNTGATMSVQKELRVDTTKPTLVTEPWDHDTIVDNFDMILTPTVGVSGIKKIELISALDNYGAPIDTYTPNSEITAVDKVYKLNITENGKYSFKITANNGYTTYLKDVVVDNITVDVPEMSVKAVTYSKDHTPNVVPSNTWAPDRIELSFTLTNQDKMHQRVQWMYRNNDEETPVWKEVVDTKGEPTYQYNFSEDGVYNYSFKAKSGDLESEVFDYIAKVDTSGPSSPVINETGLEENVWHNSTQKVSASFTKDLIGCEEFIQYRTYQKDADGNIINDSGWNQGDTTSVTAEGRTYVEFNTYDELGRKGTSVVAVVAIDSFAPENMTMTYETNSIKYWLNKISFENFFNDYIDVRFSANDDGDPTGANLSYYYILVDKKDAETFDAYASDNKWLDVAKDTITLSPNWEGLVYAKARDIAGNESQVIRSDGISIDNVEPMITFTPNSFATWSEQNSIDVHVSDDHENTVNSGLNVDSVIWSNNLTDNQEVKNVPLALDSDGKATLVDLADGKYQIKVTAKDMAGNEYSNTVLVKIDSILPTLALDASGVDLSSPAYVDTIKLVPTVGGSGIKEFKAWRNGAETDVEIKTAIVDGKEVRTVDLKKNGFYEFSFVSGAGKESNKVSIQIENISEEAPYIIAKGMTGTTTYTKGSWTDQNVELTVTTKIEDMYGLDLYYKVTKDGTDITPAGDVNTTLKHKGVTYFKFDGHLSVEDSGNYVYQFIAKAPNGKVSAVVTYPVKIDKNPIPDVEIKDEANYTKDVWFSTAQNITADFIDPNPDVRKYIEYNIDQETEYNSKELAWREGEAVNIAADGKHTIIFRVRSDDFNKVSAEKSVYVNIDKQTPSFTYKVTPKDGEARIAFTSSVVISGVKSFTLTKEDDPANPKTITNNQITVKETGTYIAELTSNAGKSYTQKIEVKALSEVEPILEVSLSDAEGSDIYYPNSGLWGDDSSKWADHAIKIDANITNSDVTGNMTIKVRMDNGVWSEYDNVNTWTTTIGVETDYEGGHTYDFVAISESGVTSEPVKIEVYVDKTKPAGFNIQDIEVDPSTSDLIYKDGLWQKDSQRLKTDFKQSADGSEEWISYTIKHKDNANKDLVIANKEKGNYYDLNESGIYEVTIESTDELGRIGDTKTFEVRIDKERPSDLMVTVGTNEFKDFLKNLTLGLFFKENTEITADVNYGLSGAGNIYLQIVDKESAYEPSVTSDKWNAYTGAINVDETMMENDVFHKVIYFYAVDAAGNRTDVYRTDGITVDKVAPVIDLELPVSEDTWTDQNTITIIGGDANAIDAIKDLSGGLKEITYKLDTTPEQTGSLQLTKNEKTNRNEASMSLPDGEYNFTVNAKDYAGNEAAPVTAKIMIDTIAPTIEVSGHDASILAGSENLKIKTSVGISGYKTLLPNGTYDKTGTGIILLTASVDKDGVKENITKVLADKEDYEAQYNGTYTFTVMNNAGAVASETIVIDNLTQDVSTLNIMMTHDDGKGNQVIIDNDTWSATPVILKTTSDMIADIQYKVKSSDGRTENWTTAEDGSLTISRDGIHTVSIRAVSPTGTISMVETRVVKVDTVEPQAPYIENIDDHDGWYAKARTVKAMFSADMDGCDEWLQYSVNGGTWSDGDQVTITQPGISSVEFRVMDELGRVTSGSLSKVDVKLDLSAPTGVKVELVDNDVTKALNALTLGNYYKETQDVYASADFSDSGIGYFEFQIVNKGETFDDSKQWKRRSLSGTDMVQRTLITTLIPGFEGSVYVRAVDAAGNASAIVNTSSVMIDNVAPSITLPKLNDDEWLNSSDIQIGVSDDGSGVDWDSVTYSYIKGGKTYTGKVILGNDGKTVLLPPLENGEYTLSVTATDKAGNSATESTKLRIDTIRARIIKVTLDPENVSSDKVLVKAQIEDKSVSGLKSVTIVSKTINETAMTPVLNEDGTVNTDGWYSFTVTSSASYTIKAETNAGLVSTRVVDITNIETSDPVLKVNAVYTQDDKKGHTYTSGEWANANIDVTVANVTPGLDIKDYYYRIEGLDGKELVKDTSISSTKGAFLQEVDLEGSYDVIFYAVSEGGRRSEDVRLRVNIDRSVPNTPVVKDADSYTMDDWTNNPAGRDVEASFEPTSGAPEWIEYNINDEWTSEHELYWRRVPANGIINVNIEGSNKLIFRTVDETGRISSETKPAYVNIDTTAPKDLYIKAQENVFRKALNDATYGIFFKETVEVTIDGDFEISGLDRIEYQVLGVTETLHTDKGWKTYDGKFYIGNDETKVVYARAYDRAGNVTSIIRSDNITVETDEPIISYPDYEGNDTNGWITDNWLNVKVNDKISDDKAYSGVKEVTYTSYSGLDGLSGKADFLNDDDYLIANLPDGSYYLNILAVDQAGNEAHSYFGVSIDTMKPSFNVTGDRKTPAATVTLNVLQKDIHVGASGVKEIKVTYKESDGTVVEEVLQATKAGDYPFIAYENNTYTFTLTNGAGVSTTKDVIITNIGEAQSGIYVSENAVENTWIKAEDFSFDVWSEPRTQHIRYEQIYSETHSGNAPATTPMFDVKDSTKQIQLAKSGKYEFNIETYDPESTDTPKPMIQSRNLHLWIDGDTPNKPVVPGKYTSEDWYSQSQRVQAVNNNTIIASDETIQYKVDGQGEWTSGDSVVVSLKDEFDDGRHTVSFRIVDEVGHISEVTTVQVNVSNPSKLGMNLHGENTAQTSSAKMTIWPLLAQAPIDKLTVRNMDSADSSYHEVDVRSAQAAYNYYVSENGRYEVILTDKAGNKAVQYMNFYNIVTTETKLVVTMKDNNNVTIKDDGWSAGKVTITAKDPSDESLALSKITYTKQEPNSDPANPDTTVYVYGSPIEVTTSGKTSFHFTLTRDGKVIEEKDIEVKIDTEAPLKPNIQDIDTYIKDGEEQWFNSDPVKVTGVLNPGTNQGSIEKLRYCLDDACDNDTWIISDVARVRGDGEHTLSYQAVDEVGHTSAITTVKVNIDKVVPAITGISEAKDPDLDLHKVTITASDNHKVVKILYKKVEQGVNEASVNWSENAGDKAEFVITDSFKGKIYAKAVDIAGNESPVRVSNLMDVDYSIPVITLPKDQEKYTNDNTVIVSINSGNSAIDTKSLYWVAMTSGLTPTEITRGTYNVDESGRGIIKDLPNGSYRLYVYASNEAGNEGSNHVALLIEHFETKITPTLGDLAADGLSQQIDISVHYAGDDVTPQASQLRPEKLYVKEGDIGEWIEVEGYDKGQGIGHFSAKRNGKYTFKAVHTDPLSETISATISVENIVKPADTIDLDSYIVFAAPEDKGCGQAYLPNKENGTCTFTSYSYLTANDVTLLVLDWENLNKQMSEKNVRLVQRIKIGNGTYPSDWDDVTWGDNAGIAGAKVLMTSKANMNYGKSFTYQYALMNEKDEIIGTDVIRRFGFTVTAGGGGNTLRISEASANTLRMPAYTPVNVDEGLAYQITENDTLYDESGWKVSGEEVSLGNGTYTLYTKTSNGEIKERTIEVAEPKISETISQDPIRSFLRTITFNLFYKEDMVVTLNLPEDVTIVEYKTNDTWKTYEGSIYVNREYKGEILIKAQDQEGVISLHQITMN